MRIRNCGILLALGLLVSACGGGGTSRHEGDEAARKQLDVKKRAAVQRVPPAPRRLDCIQLKCLALTFDDGPGQYTGALLDELQRTGTRATFFMLGGNIKGHEQLVKRMVYQGHELGNHSWSHRSMTTLPPKDVRSEVSRTQQAIRSASGVTPKLFRPPYGATNKRVSHTVGMPEIIWSVDTLDWQRPLAKKSNSAAVLKEARPGGIILMHDIHQSSVKAAPGIVSGLRQRGFTLVTVSELFQSNMQAGTLYAERPDPAP